MNRNKKINRNHVTSADAFKSSSRKHQAKVSRGFHEMQHMLTAHFCLLEVLAFLTSLSSKSKKKTVWKKVTSSIINLTIIDIMTHAIIMPLYSPDTSTTFVYQTKCSVLIRLGSAGILESVEDSLLDWTHWPAAEAADCFGTWFQFHSFYGRCKAMTESLEANLWYSQSVLSFIWWNSPARLWKCEHQIQKIQWQLLGGNVSGSQNLDSMIQCESKHVKMMGNMSNIVIQQILVSCFFDLYVFMYYV